MGGQQIPLVLVTGFLGAGKTTLVKYFMETMDPMLRIGIVQNEYAGANIDSTELQSSKTIKKSMQISASPW